MASVSIVISIYLDQSSSKISQQFSAEWEQKKAEHFIFYFILFYSFFLLYIKFKTIYHLFQYYYNQHYQIYTVIKFSCIGLQYPVFHIYFMYICIKKILFSIFPTFYLHKAPPEYFVQKKKKKKTKKFSFSL